MRRPGGQRELGFQSIPGTPRRRHHTWRTRCRNASAVVCLARGRSRGRAAGVVWRSTRRDGAAPGTVVMNTATWRARNGRRRATPAPSGDSHWVRYTRRSARLTACGCSLETGSGLKMPAACLWCLEPIAEPGVHPECLIGWQKLMPRPASAVDAAQRERRFVLLLRARHLPRRRSQSFTKWRRPRC
jgi:hypothetical protein